MFSAACMNQSRILSTSGQATQFRAAKRTCRRVLEQFEIRRTAHGANQGKFRAEHPRFVKAFLAKENSLRTFFAKTISGAARPDFGLDLFFRIH
jgi:hypothetical protein